LTSVASLKLLARTTDVSWGRYSAACSMM